MSVQLFIFSNVIVCVSFFFFHFTSILTERYLCFSIVFFPHALSGIVEKYFRSNAKHGIIQFYLFRAILIKQTQRTIVLIFIVSRHKYHYKLSLIKDNLNAIKSFAFECNRWLDVLSIILCSFLRPINIHFNDCNTRIHLYSWFVSHFFHSINKKINNTF